MDLDGKADQVVSLFTRAKNGLIEMLPNIITAVVVVLVGWLLAWALRRLCQQAFRRLSRNMPVGTTRAAWSEAVDDAGTGTVVANGVYWLVLLTTLMIAIDALGLPVFSRWIGGLASYLPRLVIAGALLFGGVVAGRLARNAIVKAGTRLPSSQAQTLGRLAQGAIVVTATLIAAGQLGIDVSLLTTVFLIIVAAALGGAAIAFGLGAKGVIADILAMHYVNKAYRVGQVVRVGSDQGRIVRTTRTAVLLEQADGEVSVPGHFFTDQRCTLLTEEEDGPHVPGN